MLLIVTVNKLNKRSSIPNSFDDSTSIVGTVQKGYKFDGVEAPIVSNPSLGKWYEDSDGYYYWGGGIIVLTGNIQDSKIITISGLPDNLPQGFLLGTDLSHHNENPDWGSIDTAGVSFAYLKISEGVGDPDLKAGENSNNAINSGIKIGYYHFCRPDTHSGGSIQSDAEAEATEAFEITKKLPPSNLPLVLDLEDELGWDTPLNPNNYLTWIQTFINKIIDLNGSEPIIYSRKEYLDRKLPKNHGLGKYKLWLANYSISDCNKLTCPNGWDDWAIWQFTEKAKIGGNPQLDLSILKYPDIIT